MNSPSFRLAGIVPDALLAQHVFVTGKPGSGKSSKLRVLVEGLLQARRRICIIDPKGDWYGLRSSADGKSAAFAVLLLGGDHGDLPLPSKGGREIGQLVASGAAQQVLIDTSLMDVAERTRFFMDFGEGLFRHMAGTLHLVIDECHNFAPQGKVLSPEAGKMVHWANRLASEGRGRGVTLLSASQRPQKVHKDYLTAHETLIACRLIHPLDRGAVKDWMDGANSDLAKQIMAELAEMPRQEAWVWSPEIGYGPKRISWPLFQTFDSFSPRNDGKEVVKAAANIDAIRKQLAQLLEDRAHSDPSILKEKLASITLELRKSNKRAESLEKDNQDLLKTIDALREQKKSASTKENASQSRAISESDRQELARAINGTAVLISSFESMIRKLGLNISDTEVAPRMSRKDPAPRQSNAPASREKSAHSSRSIASADSDLSGPEKRILDALAWWNCASQKEAFSKTQVAFVAGYRPGSGGFNNLLGKLRAKQLIEYGSPGMVQLTHEGAREATSVAVPATTDALQEMIFKKLSQPQQRILQVVVDAYPNSLDKTELAQRAYYSPGSGGFNNLLGSLRSLELIDYPKPGAVVALPVLFLE